MSSYSFLFCLKILLFNVILIIGTNEITEGFDYNSILVEPQENYASGNLDFHDKSIKVPFHIDLAHLYVEVMKRPNADSFRTMNNYTKIILYSAKKMIQKLQNEYRGREIPLSIYKNVFSRFTGLKLNETKRNFLKMNLPTKKGMPKVRNKDAYLKLKIKSWMTTLIGDKDIVLSVTSRVNEGFILKALSKLGVKFKSWKSIFYRKMYEEQEIVDVGLIRYPDFSSPFFLLYRLKFVIYRTSRKILMLYQVDKNGISGSITTYRYVPDEKTIKILNLKKLRDNESKRAERILGGTD